MANSMKPVPRFKPAPKLEFLNVSAKAPEKADPNKLVGKSGVVLEKGWGGDFREGTEVVITAASATREELTVRNAGGNELNVRFTAVGLLPETLEDFQEEVARYEERIAELRSIMDFMEANKVDRFDRKFYRATKFWEEVKAQPEPELIKTLAEMLNQQKLAS